MGLQVCKEELACERERRWEYAHAMEEKRRNQTKRSV